MNPLQRAMLERKRRLRLSYSDLEHRSGINRATLWSIFNGPMKREPKKEVIERIAKALELEPAALVQETAETFGWYIYRTRSKDRETLVLSLDKVDDKLIPAIQAFVDKLRQNGDR